MSMNRCVISAIRSYIRLKTMKWYIALNVKVTMIFSMSVVKSIRNRRNRRNMCRNSRIILPHIISLLHIIILLSNPITHHQLTILLLHNITLHRNIRIHHQSIRVHLLGNNNHTTRLHLYTITLHKKLINRTHTTIHSHIIVILLLNKNRNSITQYPKSIKLDIISVLNFTQ